MLNVLGFQKMTRILVSNVYLSAILFFKDISPCRNSPCGANGKCFENAQNFICVCHEGYAGQTCLEGELFQKFGSKQDQSYSLLFKYIIK